MKTIRLAFWGSVAATTIVLTGSAFAQQDVVADPRHHKTEIGNDCVRVVRANFGPHEKSAAMFDGGNVVIVALTASNGFRLTFPDGKSIDTPPRLPGEVFLAPAGRIQPENVSDDRVEFIVVEPKPCK